MKRKIDERERMEMFKVEHYFFWFAFWGLLAALLIQQLFLGLDFSHVAGEWIVFMVMAVGSCIGYARKGIYDGGISKPGTKSYAIYSFAGSLLFSIVIGLGMYFRWKTSIGVTLGCIAICFTFLFALLFVCLWATGTWIKKRRKKLEQVYDDLEDERT